MTTLPALNRNVCTMISPPLDCTRKAGAAAHAQLMLDVAAFAQQHSDGGTAEERFTQNDVIVITYGDSSART